jgi:diaminopimelate decarboxylase
MWQVLVRLNPELGAGGGVHPYLATGTASAKFGVPMGQLETVLAILETSTKITIVGK